MANENAGVYEPGQNITGHCSAAVTGRRFLKISGNRQSGSSGTDPCGNVTVNHATAAGRICGVSDKDAPSGGHVGIHRGAGRVTYVDVVGTVAAFGEVEVGANGTAVPKASGVAVGYAVTGVADAVGQICLYG